ncbi:putative NLR family CARD domain-containing protein 4 [Apostichopus japonicus]|uniref:Putative NLR family CARD domain-containing protein 4 n=1 Tax=Stichopus japonicus TaxID=307972 RepID=A0A2G8JJS0_STIJA|nr:putative NLR family CARD domain-containing protein 4 [Apostichopus japonicus]
MERLTVQDKKSIFINSLKRRYKLQYDAIQPIPYIKDRLYCVDKVFVEGGTEIYVVEGATKEKEGPWVRVDSYKDIFTDPRMKAKRRIIEAEAGYGKSTVTLQLAYDWCNGVKDSPFKDVEILILLRLRQLNSKISIYHAIKLFLAPSDPRIKSSDIKDIIESCSSVKVLLDGYDEFPDRDGATGSDVGRIITSNLLGNIDVTLTTRYLPKDYDKANTKRVRLVGFDAKARDQYIRKAVTGEDDESVAKIKRALQANPILDDLCQVPLIFVMFSHMTHEKTHFQKFKSVTEFFSYMIQCFHSHLSNKSMDKSAKAYNIEYAVKYKELSKVAFEGLCGENQQLSWRKDGLCTRLGQGFCQHYIAVGILVEEEVSAVTNEQTSATDIQTRTD